MIDCNGMLIVPHFARLDEYRGIWAMEERALSSYWSAAQAIDLTSHVAAHLAQPVELKSLTEQVSIAGGQSISIVSIVGTMMKQQPSLGGTSTVQVRRDIRAATADPNVAGIMLAIDSPGGQVFGTDELANDVRGARRRKPVWAFANDMMASAAYWFGSQAERIFANSPLAQIGSIGTYATMVDDSQAAEKAGFRVLRFATGPLKGIPSPGVAITEEQAAYFQALVDGSQRHFDAAIMRGRGFNATQLNEVKTGAVFLAEQAQAMKLIDGIQSFEKTLDALAQSVRARNK